MKVYDFLGLELREGDTIAYSNDEGDFVKSTFLGIQDEHIEMLTKAGGIAYIPIKLSKTGNIRCNKVIKI